MKKVHTNDMVAHLWANQSQVEAKNAQGNFYFQGDTIYSYGRHFPIARHVNTKHGHVILFTTRRYSVTTAKHITIVRHAIPRNMEVLEVLFPSDYYDHGRNLKAMEETLAATLTTAAKARTQFEYLWSTALATVAQHTRYREVFELTAEVKALSIPEDWKERARVKLKEEAEERKKARAKKEAAEAIRRQHDYDNMMAWIEGAELPHDGTSYAFPEIRIRLKDAETVETSRGAEIPLSHARKLWDWVHLIYIGDREPYSHNGHALHAGAFVVNFITKEGTLKAGCHTLKYDAMKDFAVKMNWPMPVAGQTTLEF